MDISNIHCNPHSLSGVGSRPIRLGLDRDVSNEANLQRGASIVPEQPSQRHDLAENYLAPSQHTIGDETTDVSPIPKITGAFMIDPHKTTFETTAADLDTSIYYAFGPPPNPSNLGMHRSCAEYGIPTASGPKRRNSGRGDDQGGGKKHRSGKHDKNTPSRRDGADGNGNGGRGPDENDNISNLAGNTPPPTNFACLFYKLDPEKHKRCANCVLTSWGRVLQHLKRVHLVKGEHCAICRLTFIGKDGEDLKNAHGRPFHCQRVDITQSGILLAEEYNKLKNMRALPDEEKWNEAWHRLFPRLETPSAFSETHLEYILRTAWPTCLMFLQRAQGHNDLASLATDFFEALTRTRTPARRVLGSDAAPSQAPAPQSSSGLVMPSSTLPDTLQPSQQPPFAQPRQAPSSLSAQVEHGHSGISAQEPPFGSDAFQCGQPTRSQSLLGSDLAHTAHQQDFSMPETPFAMRESLQGIGANFLDPVLFLDNSYTPDGDDLFWRFSTTPQPDSENQGSETPN